MEEGKPSDTSTLAAVVRAAHLSWDAEPKILCDELALPFTGLPNEAALRMAWDGLQAEMAGRHDEEFGRIVLDLYRAFVILRNRYAEDELDKAIANGITQYVILGAGLDSFAYRRPDLDGHVQVIEVDHPATQAWKRNHLEQIGVKTPGNLTFLPVDFERQDLRDALCAGGYDADRPGFFSWLGVTEYLGDDAIFSTFRCLASFAAGTEIVFEYALDDSLLDATGQRLMALSRELSRDRGEPFLSVFDPKILAGRLGDEGFDAVEDFDPPKANARYFARRSDGLALRDPSPLHLMKARVGSRP